MKKIVVLFCICIALIGCTRNPKVDTVAEAEAIRSIENQWTIAFQNKDIDKILSFASSEAVVMEPNNIIYIGLQASRKQLEKIFADTTILWNTTSSAIDIVEVSASGDLAYVRGINRSKIKTQTGIGENSDKWIDIWKKTDGKWKNIVQIWNSNNPTEEMTAPVATVELFTRLENEWNNATFKKDAKALNLLYAKEYTFIDQTGKVYDKQQDISEVISGNYKLDAPSVLSDIKVNTYGTVAVVKGLNTVKAKLNGKDISGTFRFVDVFVMRDGRWQCVSTQSSKLPDK
jgi:ketosteroid isomerase-like protein